MRESWTDERIDDLSGRVGDLSGRVDDLSRRVDAGFNRVDGRIDGLQKVMLQGVIALSAATLTGFAALFTLIATKL